MRRCLLIAAALSLWACSADDEACAGTQVRVTSASTGRVLVDVCAEQADTEAERLQGLAGKSGLDSSHGMLLTFPVEGEVCIQNGSVSFPIDVVYAASDGNVVAVERDVAGGDATPRCHPGTRRVLEVARSVADPVSVGDQLRAR
ncbi:MAG: DUF192 domain-containing protein [Polyangiaceae bacterium]